MISPVMFRSVASGLMIESVRSLAITKKPSRALERAAYNGRA
jgi:hypothetical protein